MTREEWFSRRVGRSVPVRVCVPITVMAEDGVMADGLFAVLTVRVPAGVPDGDLPVTDRAARVHADERYAAVAFVTSMLQGLVNEEVASTPYGPKPYEAFMGEEKKP